MEQPRRHQVVNSFTCCWLLALEAYHKVCMHQTTFLPFEAALNVRTSSSEQLSRAQHPFKLLHLCAKHSSRDRTVQEWIISCILHTKKTQRGHHLLAFDVHRYCNEQSRVAESVHDGHAVSNLSFEVGR